MNELKLVANIVEREAMRYTPAGIPIVSAKLFYSAQQTEAGMARVVEFEIAALAAGEISDRLNQAELAIPLQFTGFLARKNRNSKSLVFHVTNIETYLTDH